MARRWTYWDLVITASKAGTRSIYRTQWPTAYKVALKHGLLDALFPESANKLGKAIELATQLNNPVEFRKLYPAAARMLHRYGYRNDGNKI